MADNPIKYSDLVIDDGAIDQLIKKIQLLEKTFLASQKTFQKEIAKTKKATEDSTDATDNQEKELEKLEKQLEKLLKANQDLNTAEGEMTAQKKQALKLAKQEQTLKKKLIELTDDQALSNEELKLEIREQQKALKDQAKENKGLTGEYAKQSKTLNNLRKKYKDLAVAGKENSEEARKLLVSVTELDTKLKAVDKSVGQTQRSVGNYKDQVKEALEETDLFSGSMAGAIDESGALGDVVAKLQTIIAFLTKILNKNNKEQNESTRATIINKKVTKSATKTQLTFAGAVNIVSKSFKRLKTVIMASGIGLLVVALGTIISALTESTAGVDGLAGVMGGLGSAFKVVFGRIALFGKGLIDVFEGIITGFKGLSFALSGNFIKASFFIRKASYEFGVAKESFSKAGDGFVEAVSKAFESGKTYSKLTKDLEKSTSGFRVEMAKLNAEAEIQEEIEADATNSIEKRRIAIEKAIVLQQKASAINSKITKLELEAEQVKLKAFEKGTESRRIQQDVVNEKIIANIEAETEAKIKADKLDASRNMLAQDRTEQYLDIIIDGFDSQKTVNEQLIASDKLRFDERRKLLKETEELQKKALKDEVALLQKTAIKEIKIRELIEEQDGKELKRKIETFELSEVLTARLFEVVKESRIAERDLDQAGIDLEQEHFEIRKEIIEQLEDLKLDKFEAERKRDLEAINLEEKRAIESIEIEKKKFSQKSEEFKKLNESIKLIEEDADKKRKQVELDAFIRSQELAYKKKELELLLAGETQKEINEKLKKLKIEQLDAEVLLRKQSKIKSIDEELEVERLRAQKEVDIEKDKAQKIKDIQDKTASAVFNSFQRNLDKQIDELDKLESKQLSIIDRQEQRAQEGLSNNLAFEESALAELEQKKIKAQKKQIALDKVQALYNAYSSASASGDKNAIITVLRDFSILQGIESAISSFGSGTGEHGDINDSLKAGQNGSKNGNSITNGVIRGESHAKRGFGVPILAEGNEGIWKGSTMDKFGKNNFIQLTKSIDNGSIGSNFMQPQVNALQVVQSSSGVDGALLQEMKETRKAIQNKPEQVVDVQRLSDNIIDFVDVRKSNNKKVINRYRVKKKRI